MKTKTKGIFLGNFENALLTKVKLLLGVVQKLQWPYFSVIASETFIIYVRFSSLILNPDITFAGNLIYNLNLKFKSYLKL